MSVKAAAKLEKQYMTKSRKKVVLLFEESDLIWDADELMDLKELNELGHSIDEMTRFFKREDPDEIFLALFHLAKEGKIKKLDLRRLLG